MNASPVYSTRFLGLFAQEQQRAQARERSSLESLLNNCGFKNIINPYLRKQRDVEDGGGAAKIAAAATTASSTVTTTIDLTFDLMGVQSQQSHTTNSRTIGKHPEYEYKRVQQTMDGKGSAIVLFARPTVKTISPPPHTHCLHHKHCEQNGTTRGRTVTKASIHFNKVMAE
jgi:hypothetical protein